MPRGPAMTICRALLLKCLSLLPVAAVAHPHVYMDAALILRYDSQGQLEAVEVEWAYDELYSLLILGDYGLDPDGDGALTAAELAILQGFDGEWEPGFDGRLFLSYVGRRVAMQDPRDFTAEYRDGRLVSRHLHELVRPVEAGSVLRIQVYDPEFYVDFSLPDAPRIEGRDDCRVTLIPGEPGAASAAYRRAIEVALAQDSGQDAEMLVVDIGAAGADEALVECGP